MEWDGGIFEVEWWDWREVSLSNSVALSYQIQTIPLYGAVVGGKQRTREPEGMRARKHDTHERLGAGEREHPCKIA